MLQQDVPDDFVLATGTSHTVREFADLVFRELDMELEWVGENENERAIEMKSGKLRVSINKKYYRPTEVESLIGDASKAKEKLGWEPKTTFLDLVKLIVQADLKNVQERGY